MSLWPNGDEKIKGLRAGIIETSGSVFQRYGINTPILIAHVMAQISHECGAGHDVVENLNYTAERLMQVWPRHFNMGNASSYAHNPQKLANFIYNPPQHTDLGNRLYSSDGWNYRGRGASQTTGFFGYQKVERKTGIPVVANPDLINDPRYFLECGVADFIICGCLPYALADDVIGVTKKLNGGMVGLAERRAWLSKWKSALSGMSITAGDTKPRPTDPKEQDTKPEYAPEPQTGFAVAFKMLASFISKLLKGK